MNEYALCLDKIISISQSTNGLYFGLENEDELILTNEWKTIKEFLDFYKNSETVMGVLIDEKNN